MLMRWVLAVLALSIVVGVAVMLRRPSSPVYSVPEIQAGLLAHPNAWLGRIVLVHGIPVTQVLVSGRAVRTIVVRGRVVSGAFSGPLCNTWCPWAHLALAPILRVLRDRCFWPQYLFVAWRHSCAACQWWRSWYHRAKLCGWAC